VGNFHLQIVSSHRHAVTSKGEENGVRKGRRRKEQKKNGVGLIRSGGCGLGETVTKQISEGEK